MPFIQSYFKQRIASVTLSFVGAYLTFMGWTGSRDGISLPQTARILFVALGIAILLAGGYTFVRYQRKSDAARRDYYEGRRLNRIPQNHTPQEQHNSTND